MTADPDTRSDELYAPADEVLPEGGDASDLGLGGYCSPGEPDAFAGSRERFEGMVEWLGGEQADRLEHSELEDRLQGEGRELLRGLFEDRMTLRAQREERLDEVVDQVIRSLEFSGLAKYAFGLAQTFNAFYHRYPILNEDNADRKRWRAAGVAYVLAQLTRALDLMGIDVPNRM